MKNSRFAIVFACSLVGVSLAGAVSKPMTPAARQESRAIINTTASQQPGDAAVVAAFNQHFVPLVNRDDQQVGTIIAKYRLQAAKPDGTRSDWAIESLVGYDLATRASFFVATWSGDYHITGPEGDVWRGHLAAGPEQAELRYLDEFPLNNTIVEQSFPAVILNDLLDRPDALVSVGPRVDRIKQSDGSRLDKPMPGVQATFMLPAGQRFADRQRPEGSVELAPLTIAVDDAGRLVWYARGNAEPYFYQYHQQSPANFPIATAHNGSDWEVVMWDSIAAPDAQTLFSPESVLELAANWGLKPLHPQGPGSLPGVAQRSE